VSGSGGAPAGTGGMSGTGGSGPAGTGGAGPAVLFCPQYPDFHPSTAGCGVLIVAGRWEYLWKGDMACASCTSEQKPIVGCKVPPVPPQSSDPGPQPTALLCVSDCRKECCWKRVGGTCETDANCCAPLTCQDNGAGKLKSCR
jgi:hypothetical protein